MDSKKYVKAAVEVVRRLLNEDGRELKTSKTKHEGPMPINYEPELDSTPHCDEERASRYRQIIGILRWAIELGRIDILTEVSLLSQYQANPREGHLEALYWIANYLHRYPMRRLVMNHTTPNIDETVFRQYDWTDFYGKVHQTGLFHWAMHYKCPALWMQTMQEIRSQDNRILESLFYSIIPRLLHSVNDKTHASQAHMDQSS